MGAMSRACSSAAWPSRSGVHGQPRTSRRSRPPHSTNIPPLQGRRATLERLGERVQRHPRSAGCKVAPPGPPAPWGRARPKAAALEGVQPSWLHVSVSGAGLQDQGSRGARTRRMLAGLLDTCTSVVRQRILLCGRYARRAAGAVKDGAPGGARGGRAARGRIWTLQDVGRGVQVGFPHLTTGRGHCFLFKSSSPVVF